MRPATALLLALALVAPACKSEDKPSGSASGKGGAKAPARPQRPLGELFTGKSPALPGPLGKIKLGMSKAHQLKAGEEPALRNVVEALAIGSGLPMPKLYVIEDSAPNAFATGRDPKHASIAVTRGLLDKLDRAELEGVMAHELSHVGNYDIRTMVFAAVLAGTIVLFADVLLRWMRFGGARRGRRDRDGGSAGGLILIVALVLAVVGPIVARIITLAVSREREYLADASAALLTRHPQGLARALAKIAGDPEPLEVANKATEPLYIANPLKDRPAFLDGLFETHPPIAERIRRLESM